jgi:hypothetical protein
VVVVARELERIAGELEAIGLEAPTIEARFVALSIKHRRDVSVDRRRDGERGRDGSTWPISSTSVSITSSAIAPASSPSGKGWQLTRRWHEGRRRHEARARRLDGVRAEAKA